MKRDNGGIRVRRGALRQRRRRMFFVGLRLVVLFVLVAGLGHAFSQYMKESPRFTVKRIQVEGAHALDLETIRRAADIKESDNLWRASAEDIRRRIEAIPYVKHAEVRRMLPDTVIIRIEERQAAATLLVNNRAFEVDENGLVLRELDWKAEPVGALITGIPDMGPIEPGDRVEHPAFAAAMATWRAFTASPLAEFLTLGEIAAQSPNAILTYFDEIPFEVRWGRRDFEAQAMRFYVLWREMNGALPCTEYLDLRFGSDLACK